MTQQEILTKLKFDLEVRDRKPDTVNDYLYKVGAYQDYFGKPADQMGEAEISEFLHYLITVKKLHTNSVNVYNSAIRFVYLITLNRNINVRQIPRIKQIRSIPVLPTKEELDYLFNLASCNIRNKALFMTIYGSGLRLSEAANLKVNDIDSAGNRIFIRKGKGGRDRYAMLPKKTLEVLREYYRVYKPKEWLFVTKTGTKMTNRGIQDSWKYIVRKSGIPKHITVHTLRHCFATHLLNEGNNVFQIKRLLGHVRIDTTTWYLQLSDSETLKLNSPLDTMGYDNA
jgi:integrase/recombinase XerD